MIRIGDIEKALLEYHPQADIGLVRKAYIYAAKVHEGQVRLSGEPYLAHPLEVTAILTQMRLDEAAIAAGLLHDTVEDTAATMDDITEMFGREVALVVEGVTKITGIEYTSQDAAQSENMRKMIVAMAKDIRVLLVKLADRLHNMRTLGYQKQHKQARIAQETLDIYAPLAGRLGIYRIKSELEDLCLYYLEPEQYRRIVEGLDQRIDRRQDYVSRVTDFLTDQMATNGIVAEVKGRPKHLYSIYKKMIDQQLTLDQLFDIIGFRIVVKHLRDCYEALGVVHSLWKPIPGRFKDYISLPKANRYQSLHTAVVGPEARRIEIQIRTEAMDKVAEEGIAAHWRYKEGGKMDAAEGERFAWLRQLLEWQRELSDPRDFLDSVKVELYEEEVYVFTPNGEVKVLPKGATPIDFAYAIHSEVGQTCIGAKVNDRMVPLRYKLQTGDMVEIKTQKNHPPSKDWLNHVVTNKAKQKLRAWIKNEEQSRSVAMGRDLLDKELRKAGSTLNRELKSGELAKVAVETFSLKDVDALIGAVGYGRLTAKQVVNKLYPAEDKAESSAMGAFLDRVVRRVRKKPSGAIQVKGLDDILTRYANCCNPLPGDEVIGFITHGRGVSIHRADCPNVRGVDPARLVEVEWQEDSEIGLPVNLKIHVAHQIGSLASVSNVFGAQGVNITNAHVDTTEQGQGEIDITALVKNRNQLDKLILELKKIRSVYRIERLSNPEKGLE